MLLDVPCKQGKLQVLEEGMLRVMAPFNKIVWQMPCAHVTGFTTQPGMLMTVSVIIQTTQGAQHVEMLTQANFQKLQTLFAHLQIQTKTVPQGKEWYHDLRALTHVATYTDEKQMQKEVEAAAHFGWIPQNTAATAGHINVGRTVTKFMLTGGIGMMTGASRSKDKLTITFVRTPQWMTQNT